MEYNENKNIAIIGAGYVGLCTGAILSDIGKKITFVDVDLKKINSINNGESPIYEPGVDELIQKGVSNGSIIATDDYNKLKNIKIFIVSVNTPIDKYFNVDLKFFKTALESLSKVITAGSLVIIRSTIPPLTTRNVVLPIFTKGKFELNKDVNFAVMPERLAEGHAIKDMRETPLIIGANNDESIEIIKSLFAPLNLRSIIVNWEEAELTKLTDNLWIDLNIALSNEIALISEKIGADARNVIKAANSLKKGDSYVNILTPGIGVGGSCLPKDPYILKNFCSGMGVELKLPEISRAINDYMPVHTFDLVEKNKTNNESKVLLLGVSFNANSGDMRYSPSIYLNDRLQAANYKVYAYDPLVNQNDFTNLKNIIEIKDDQELLSLLKDIDIIVVVAKHDIFKKLVPQILNYFKGKVIIDGRYMFNKNEVLEHNIKYVALGVGVK